jgi:diketogulonate reductase-like aldo/keto reductase
VANTGIVLQAYSPLVRTKKNEDPVLNKIAKETGKEVAQVLIRWSLQKG